MMRRMLPAPGPSLGRRIVCGSGWVWEGAGRQSLPRVQWTPATRNPSRQAARHTLSGANGQCGLAPTHSSASLSQGCACRLQGSVHIRLAGQGIAEAASLARGSLQGMLAEHAPRACRGPAGQANMHRVNGTGPCLTGRNAQLPAPQHGATAVGLLGWQACTPTTLDCQMIATTAATAVKSGGQH